MAQKDIQEIAKYMQQLDESKVAENEAYNEACKEVEAFQEIDDAELEDEVIDKASMGFIDDNCQDESDDFYAEDDAEDAFEEDVSDCVEQEVEEAEQIASIDVNVYNEDGYGEHFAQDVMKNIPGVDAFTVRTLPNGDILVRMSGSQTDLEKAFAFYLGQPSFAQLRQNDKDEFKTILKFSNGDTLAEADYREAVAHCLDPIGVKASTANLADQDTCAISIIKEEKCKRKAAKMFNALKENDFSSLSDDDLEILDSIKDAVDTGEKMDPEHATIWKQILKDMGYTEEEWNKLTPEQQDKAWKKSEKPAISRSGFAGYEPGKEPRYQIFDPKTGERITTAWNPNYTQEMSVLQHPSMLKKMQKQQADAERQADKDARAKAAMKKVRGKDTWTVGDFAAMIQNLSDVQRKQLMNALINDVKAEKGNTSDAAKDIQVIKSMFGKKQTLRDIAASWDKTFPNVSVFADKVEGNLYMAAKSATGMTNGKRALGVIATSNDVALKQRFADEFEKLMNTGAAAVRKDTIDPERRERAIKSRTSTANT